MVDVNIPREQACTQHNALNTLRNMRSGQSGWTKHTQHSSIRKQNMASTGFYLFLFRVLLSAQKKQIRNDARRTADVCWQANSIPAGRPVTGVHSALHREHDTIELLFQFQPTRTSLCLGWDFQRKQEHDCVAHADKQNLLEMEPKWLLWIITLHINIWNDTDSRVFPV